jgi:uncharacterized protein YtpQ (UPF0354 family)
MKKRKIVCIYCGTTFPKGTRTSGAKILGDHISECLKHPSSKLLKNYRLIRHRLSNLVFYTHDNAEENEYELRKMIRDQMSYVPESTKAEKHKMNTILALEALIECPKI